MADTLQDAVITIGADITKAVAAIQDLQNKLQAMQKRFSTLAIGGGLGAGQSAAIQALSKDIGALSTGLAGVAKTASEAATNITKVGTAAKTTSSQANQLQQAIAALGKIQKTLPGWFGVGNPAQIKKATDTALQGFAAMRGGALRFGDSIAISNAATSKNFKSIIDTLERGQKAFTGITAQTGHFDERLRGLLKIPQQGSFFERIFGNFQESMTLALSTLARFQAARVILDTVTAGMREFGTAAINLQDQLAQIRAITGESSEAIQILGRELRDFSKTTIIGLEEAGRGLQVFAQAGFTTSESIKALTGVVALAIGGVTTLEESAKLVTSTLQTFQLGIGQTDRIANVLVATANKSKTSIEELNVAFNYAGSSAAAAGLTIEDLNAILGVLSNNGIRASTSGTAVRQVLSSLIEPSTKAVKVFERLGINLADIDPRANDIVEVFRRLQLAGFGTAEAFEAFDKRAGSAIALLIRQADSVEEMRNRITGTDAAFVAMGVRQESLAAKTKILFNQFREFAILMTQAVIPPLTILVDLLQKLFSIINESPLLQAGIFGGFFAVMAKLSGLATGTLPSIIVKFLALSTALKGIFAGTGTLAGVANIINTSKTAMAGAAFKLHEIAVGAAKGITIAGEAAARSTLKVEGLTLALTNLIAPIRLYKAGMLEAGAATVLFGDALKAAFAPFAPLAIFTALIGAVYLFVRAMSKADEAMARRVEEQRSASNTAAELVSNYKSTTDALDKLTPGTVEYNSALTEVQKSSAALVRQYPDLVAQIDKTTGKLKTSTEQLANSLILDPLQKRRDELLRQIKREEAIQTIEPAGPFASAGFASRTRQELAAIEAIAASHAKDVAQLEKIRELSKEINDLARFGGALAASKLQVEVQKEAIKALGEEFEKLTDNQEKVKTFLAALAADPSILQSQTKILDEVRRLLPGFSEEALASIKHIASLRETAINASLDSANAGVQAAEAVDSRIREITASNEQRIKTLREQVVEAEARLEAKLKNLSPEEEAAYIIQRKAEAVNLGLLNTLATEIDAYLATIDDAVQREVAQEGINNMIALARDAAPEMRQTIIDALVAGLPQDAYRLGVSIANTLSQGMSIAIDMSTEQGLIARKIAAEGALEGDSSLKTALAKQAEAEAELAASRLKDINKIVEAVEKQKQGEIDAIEIKGKTTQVVAAETAAIEIKYIRLIEQAQIEQLENENKRAEEAQTIELERLQARIDIANQIKDLEVEAARRGRRAESISAVEHAAEISRINNSITINQQKQVLSQAQLVGLEKELALATKQRKDSGSEIVNEAELDLSIAIARKKIELTSLSDANALLVQQRGLVRNVGEVAIQIGPTIQTAISDAFEGVILGTSKLSDVIKNAGNSLLKSITSALSQSLVEKLGFDKAFVLNMQGLGNQTESILGGAFSTVFGNAGSLVAQFVGLAGGLIGKLAGGIGGSFSGIGNFISGFAGQPTGTTTGAPGIIGSGIRFVGGGLTSGGGFLSQLGGGLGNINFGNFASFADSGIGLGLTGATALGGLAGFSKASKFSQLLTILGLAKSGLGLAGMIPGLGILGKISGIGPGTFIGGALAKLFPSLFAQAGGAAFVGGGAPALGNLNLGSDAFSRILQTQFGFTGGGSPAASNISDLNDLIGNLEAGGATGAGTGINATQALSAITSIASLIYTFYQAAQQFKAAKGISLDQGGPKTALQVSSLALPIAGAGAGAALGAVAGAPAAPFTLGLSVLAGAAIGAAIGQAVSSAVSGAVGKGVSEALKKGLTQAQLEHTVRTDPLANLFAGGLPFLKDRGGTAANATAMVIKILNPIAAIIDAIITASIPSIDKYFRHAAEQAIERVTNLDIQASQYQPRAGLGRPASARFTQFFTGPGNLTGDARTTAQFVAAAIGAGTMNQSRIFQIMNMIRNALARGRQDVEGVQKALYDIVRGMTGDRFIAALKLFRNVFQGTKDALKQKDLIGRAYQEIFPGADMKAVVDDLLRSGALGASPTGRKASRKAVGEAAGELLSTSGTFEENLGKFGDSIGQALSDAIAKSFKKFITSGRSPIGIAFAALFDDVTKGISKALKKGLDAAGQAGLQAELLHDITIAAQIVRDFSGSLQYFSELFKQLQEIIEDALLTPEERQAQRVDLITQLLDQIGSAFSKMLGLILDNSKRIAQNIQRRFDLANLGNADTEGNISIDAVNAIRNGIDQGFSLLQENFGNMTLEQQQAALQTFAGSVDDFISMATRQIKEQFAKAIDLAKQAKAAFENIQKIILQTRLADPTATPQDRLGAIQKEIEKQQKIMLTGKPEEQLTAAQRLAELFPQLLDVASNQLDQSGPEFASVRSSVEVGLNKVATFLESQGAKLEPLEEQQTAALQAIKTTVEAWLTFIEDKGSLVYTQMYDNTTRMIKDIKDMIIGDGSNGTDLYTIITNASLPTLKKWSEEIRTILTAAGIIFPENTEGAGGIGGKVTAVANNQGIRNAIEGTLAKSFGVERGKIPNLTFPTELVLKTLRDNAVFNINGFDATQQAFLKAIRSGLTIENLGLEPLLNFPRLADVLSYVKSLLIQLTNFPNSIFEYNDITDLYDRIQRAFLEKLGEDANLATAAHQLAQGGVAMRRINAVIAEAGSPEAVVPLTSKGLMQFGSVLRSALRGAQANMPGLMQDMTSMGGGTEINVSITLAEGSFQIHTTGDAAAMRNLPTTVVDMLAKEIIRGRLNKPIKDITRRVA